MPKTKHTADKAVNLPIKAINYLKTVVGDMFPELTGVGITDTRMCWYTVSKSTAPRCPVLIPTRIRSTTVSSSTMSRDTGRACLSHLEDRGMASSSFPS